MVSMKRLLRGAATALALSLVTWVSSASAKTVYDYVYSGTYFDGSGAAGKTFNTQVGGLEYDRADHQFYVGNGGDPGWISRLTPAGAGVNFSALSQPYIPLTASFGSTGPPQVVVDQTGGPHDGNVYGNNLSNQRYGFLADGTAIPGFATTEESSCGLAVEPPDGEKLYVAGRNGGYHFTWDGKVLTEESVGSPGLEPGVRRKWDERGKTCLDVIDNEGGVYGGKYTFFGGGRIVKTNLVGVEQYELNENDNSSATAIDYSNDDVFVLASDSFEIYDHEGRLLGQGFGGPDPLHSYLGISGGPIGITVDPTTHDVWVANRRDYGGGVTHVEKFERTNPHIIPDTTAISPDYSNPTGETIGLRGTVNPDGMPTTDCHFEYGPTQELGSSVPCTQGNILTGSTDQEVTSVPIAFKKGSRYYYKLFAKNADNQVAPSNVQAFIPQGKPILGTTSVDRVKTDGARLSTEMDPNGGNVSFHFDYGVKGGPLDHSTEESDTFGFDTIPGQFAGEDVYQPGVYEGANLVNGLEPDTSYEYQAVVTNEAGTVRSAIGEFKTDTPDAGTDSCGNALARQQSGSSLLLDCRGYELVSPANAGGFDVQSDVVPFQAPLDAYPRATDSALFSMHFGVVPGIAGSPTNLGLDPYVARRGANGWVTEYVGLPADGMADDGAFGSPLLGADASLHEFAFGGKDICAPCFADGSTNIPLRRADGELVKGMAGSLNPAADPAGTVRQPFSANGSHFVFGSAAKFEAAGDAGGSIYDRDLAGGGTQVVSTLPNGSTIAGGEVGELAISGDGSRIVVGKRISTDAKGNEFWHLYMHVGSSANSVDLTPGTTSGVLFDGMSEDGTRVFFTTMDKLLGDTDDSADIYETSVDAGGPATTRLISTKNGVPSNTDACEPPNLPDSWNAVSGDGKCSAVAFAGSAGIGADGTAYFVSPELLDGSKGEQNQANLYVVKPGGDPAFVSTISSSVGNEQLPPPEHPVVKASFLSGLKTPETLAVDQSNGDLYVTESGGGGVLSRYTSAGAPKEFTEGPGAGTNKIVGLPIGGGESQVAVDSAPSSPLKGTIYVTSNSGSVYAFSNAGEKIGELTGFGEACGVSVDQANGDVYVGDYFMPGIWSFHPESGGPVSNASYAAPKKIVTEGVAPCNVEADSAGHAYAKAYGSNNVKQYAKSEFSPAGPIVSGKIISGTSTAIQSEPGSADLYVDEGGQIAVYDDETGALIQRFGAGSIASSKGVAIDASDGHVYATSGNNIVEFGKVQPPFQPVGSPAVLHGSSQSGVHSFGDFQVTPDGRYAVFASTRSLTGYPNFRHSEVYRYDSDQKELACASCPPTLGAPVFDTALPNHGLALTDDGRVFFTTQESLALRDTNEKTDAYEWSNGRTQLISTGISPQDSGLVTVSADGRNAFFFTRQVLTHEDENGNSVKIYDARESGGAVHDPERKQCAASDECHGPGTEEPPPPVINTITSTTVGSKKVACGKNRVKRNGRCVKKPKKRRSKSRRHHRRTGGNG
jgi:hypothetical protein